MFGEVAALYDRYRPVYPGVLIDETLAYAGVSGVGDVVDVGAGTGQLTLPLAERGYDVTAIEPNTEMAAVAQRKLERYANAEVIVDRFENVGLQGPFNLVISGQAWHWIDPVLGWRKAHELLGSGGAIALAWHESDMPDHDVRRSLDRAYEEFAPELTAREPGSIRKLAGHGTVDEAMADSRLFEPEAARHYAWSRPLNAAGYANLMRTQSDHRMLPAQQLEALLEGLTDVINAHGGNVTLEYDTTLYLGRRIA